MIVGAVNVSVKILGNGGKIRILIINNLKLDNL